MNVVILIPSLDPDEMLLSVVQRILAEGFTRILIVNDGSSAEYLPVFDELEKQGCAVVHHAVNQGKGRALKTGINYIMKYMPDVAGIVTCDSDGQHEPSAIRLVAETMLKNPDKIVLGVRKFFEAKVPLANLMGNTITRGMFRLLTGLSFGDTQCGLRALPKSVLPWMVKVPGERFDYENVMLLALREHQQDYIEVPMRASYETVQQGKKTHFHKLYDSVRIYKKLLGFAAVPISLGLLASAAFMIAAPYLAPAGAVWAAGISTLVCMLLLWLLTPARRTFDAAAMAVGLAAVSAGLAWLLIVQAGIPPIGAWWLKAVVTVPLTYWLWLITRFGRKPKRIKQN